MENFFQLEKLEEQLKCAVCLDIYTNPRTLSCLHSYCEECLQRLAIYQQHSITCPNCRCNTIVPTPGGVTKFPSAFHLNGLKDIYNTLKRTSLSARNVTCDNCGSPNDIGYCRGCKGFLCPACIDDHVGCSEFSSLQQSLASLGGGGLTSLNQLPENKDLCPQHSEPLETFCRSCNEVICLQCIVSNHSSHDTVSLVDGYFEDYPLLESSLNTICQMIPSINHSLIDIDNQIEDVREQDEIIKAEIRLMVESLTKALQKSARLLTTDVEKITEARMARLSEQKKLAKSALKQTKHVKSYMDQCLQVGTIQQIALIKRQMMERMNALKDQIKLEEFIPIQNTAIKLIKDETLSETIEHMGQVIPLEVLQQCKVKRVSDQGNVPEEETISFPVSIQLPQSVPLEVPKSSLSCSIAPPRNTDTNIIASVSPIANRVGCYMVDCSPIIYGYHDVCLSVNDVELKSLQVVVPSDLHYSPVPEPSRLIHNLEYPYGIAINASGQIITTESNSHAVKVMDRELKTVKTFGGENSCTNVEFSYPRGVTISPDNFILVTDNKGVHKISINGHSSGSLAENGEKPGQFNTPEGIIASHFTHHIYVADRGNNRIQVLNPDLTSFLVFGSKGSGEGQFDEPWGLAIDSDEFLYVVDSKNHRIQKFTSKGEFVLEFGKTGEGTLSSPAGITISHKNQLYVTEKGTHSVAVFDTEGHFINRFGRHVSNPNYCLKCPEGIDFDCNGLLYICDYFNKRIVVY